MATIEPVSVDDPTPNRELLRKQKDRVAGYLNFFARSQSHRRCSTGITDEEFLEIVGNTALNMASAMINHIAGTEIESDGLSH